jgi:opacity protein-like surface antigen
MKNSIFKKAALSGLVLMSSFISHAGDWTGNVSGYVGSKSLKDNDWTNLDSQLSLGLIFDIKKQEWPFSIALDVIGSGDVYKNGSNKDTASTLEYDFGIRKIFNLNNSSFKPYIGGGAAFISADFEQKDVFNTIKESQSEIGSWIGAGTYYEINDHFIVGLDVRYSKAETKIFDDKREIGGLNAGFTIGYHF